MMESQFPDIGASQGEHIIPGDGRTGVLFTNYWQTSHTLRGYGSDLNHGVRD
jgi:hypothetical protein